MAGDVCILATGATLVAVPPSSLRPQGCLKLDVIRYDSPLTTYVMSAS